MGYQGGALEDQAPRKKRRTGALTFAQTFAVALAVLCPHCGEAQPAPPEAREEGEEWSPDDLKREALKHRHRFCVSCDEPFALAAHGHAQVDYSDRKKPGVDHG